MLSHDYSFGCLSKRDIQAVNCTRNYVPVATEASGPADNLIENGPLSLPSIRYALGL